jgi:predicted RND superfamily exporter protein
VVQCALSTPTSCGSRSITRKQVTDSFVTKAYAMLVAIGLVYLIMVILFRSLLVPVVILCALPLAVTRKEGISEGLGR